MFLDLIRQPIKNCPWAKFSSFVPQYIHPKDGAKLGQAELVVIDEAAAIPLPLVKSLLGPYLVFMASTINGYEGTGRSLSLKLLQQLRTQSNHPDQNSGSGNIGRRTLHEVTLEESIRYRPGDLIESWLTDLLCLNATDPTRIKSLEGGQGGGCPLPQDCDLYYVNRDTLFCYHKASEIFLHRLMCLYVASHYKVRIWLNQFCLYNYIFSINAEFTERFANDVRCTGPSSVLFASSCWFDKGWFAGSVVRYSSKVFTFLFPAFLWILLENGSC